MLVSFKNVIRNMQNSQGNFGSFESDRMNLQNSKSILCGFLCSVNSLVPQTRLVFRFEK